MKRCLTLICLIGILLGACWASPVIAQAATTRDANSAFLIATLSGNVYAPKGVGTVTSMGVVDKKLTLNVFLQDMPVPTAVGGSVYKVWLVDPDSATAMPGGVLAYHADGTAEGTFTTLYHGFTVVAVTAEQNAADVVPANPAILQGSVHMASMQAALATVTPRVAVADGAPPAAYFSAPASHVQGVAATGQVTLAAKVRSWTVHVAAASAASTILLMPMSDPHGPLWISSQRLGSFTISAASPLPESARVRYVIINS